MLIEHLLAIYSIYIYGLWWWIQLKSTSQGEQQVIWLGRSGMSVLWYTDVFDIYELIAHDMINRNGVFALILMITYNGNIDEFECLKIRIDNMLEQYKMYYNIYHKRRLRAYQNVRAILVFKNKREIGSSRTRKRHILSSAYRRNHRKT